MILFRPVRCVCCEHSHSKAFKLQFSSAEFNSDACTLICAIKFYLLNYLIRVLWAISPAVQEMSTLRKRSTWDLAGSTCLRRRWRSSTSPSTRCRSAHLRHVTLTCVTMTRCRSADPRHVTSTSSSRTSSPSSWRHRRHGYADAAASGWLGPPVSCHSRQSWRWRSFSRKTQTNL